MIRNLLLVLAVLSISSEGISQNDSVTAKRVITAGGYEFRLEYDSTEFFKGRLDVRDSFGSSVFYDEDFYSTCYYDTLADLDEDGNDELVLGLTTGMSPYMWSSLLIFDLKSNKLWPLEVINGEIVRSSEGNNMIRAIVRLSPAYLGALYSYLLEFRNNELIIFKDPDGQYTAQLNIDYSASLEEAITDFGNTQDVCNDGSGYITLFEAYLIQAKLSGNINKAGEFFRKTYRCDDANAAFKQIMKYVNETYDYLTSQNFNYIKD